MRWFSHRRRTGGLKAPEDRSRKPPSACTVVTLSPPGCDTMVSPAAVCSVRRTAHALLSIVNGDDSAVFRFFCPGDVDLWPLTLIFEIERDFCTVHLTAKFHHPRLIVRKLSYWQTNKLKTDKQTPLKTSTSLRYATSVGKNSGKHLYCYLLYTN